MAGNAQETAASLISMLKTKGQGDYIGEPVSTRETRTLPMFVSDADGFYSWA
jgi:hypothetical protein